MPWVRNSTLDYDGDRRTYDVYQQDLDDDCTVAGLIMMAKFVLDRDVTFAIARLWVRQAQQHFDSDLEAYQGNVAPKMYVPVGGTPYLWGHGGSAVGAVCFAFRRHFPNHRWGWVSPYGTPDNNGSLPKRLAQCTPQNPALVKIDWGNQTSHAALSLGVAGSGLLFRKMWFIDPVHGVVGCPYQHFGNQSEWLSYDTDHSSFGTWRAKGKITEALFFLG